MDLICCIAYTSKSRAPMEAERDTKRCGSDGFFNSKEPFSIYFVFISNSIESVADVNSTIEFVYILFPIHIWLISAQFDRNCDLIEAVCVHSGVVRYTVGNNQNELE